MCPKTFLLGTSDDLIGFCSVSLSDFTSSLRAGVSVPQGCSALPAPARTAEQIIRHSAARRGTGVAWSDPGVRCSDTSDSSHGSCLHNRGRTDRGGVETGQKQTLMLAQRRRDRPSKSHKWRRPGRRGKGNTREWHRQMKRWRRLRAMLQDALAGLADMTIKAQQPNCDRGPTAQRRSRPNGPTAKKTMAQRRSRPNRTRGADHGVAGMRWRVQAHCSMNEVCSSVRVLYRYFGVCACMSGCSLVTSRYALVGQGAFSLL